MGDQSEIRRFLYGVGTQKGKPGGAGGHNITVVAENRKSMGGNCTCRYVNHCRREFAGDLVHIGDHQEQSLGGGESGAQRSSLKGPVESAGGSCFALHFDNCRNNPPDILAAFRTPLVRPLAHGGSGSNGVDGDYLVEAVSDGGYRLICIENYEFRFHVFTTIGELCGRSITVSVDKCRLKGFWKL